MKCEIHMEYQYLKTLMGNPTGFQNLFKIIHTTSQHFRTNVMDWDYTHSLYE